MKILMKIASVLGILMILVGVFSPILLFQLVGGVGAIVWIGVRSWRKYRRNEDELSGGFASYAGIYMTMPELLRIVVQEELARCIAAGRTFPARKTRMKRALLTAGFVVFFLMVLILVLSGRGGSGYIRAWLIGAVVYLWLYLRCDPVSELCKAVKKQPDRDMTEVVREKTVEGHRKSGRSVRGAVYVAVSLVLLVISCPLDRTAYEPVQGGCRLEGYQPGLFSERVVTIPEEYEGMPVVAIGERAFEGARIVTCIQIPDTVEQIGSYAFKNCSRLEQIELPVKLRELNGESFKGCRKLRKITIPAGVTEIRGNTFEECSALEQVVLHDGIVDIHAYAFRNCSSLRQIRLPAGITQIHAYTFEGCSALEMISIPEGVTSIRAHAFYGCSDLASVEIPMTLKEIRSSAFRECDSLEKIILPRDTVVDERAFKDSPTTVYRWKIDPTGGLPG